MEIQGIDGRHCLTEEKQFRRKSMSSSDKLLKRLRQFHSENTEKRRIPKKKSPKLVPVEVTELVICPVCRAKEEEWEGRKANAPVTLSRVKEAICHYFKITKRQAESQARVASIVYARQIGFYLAREHANSSLTQIGRWFGGRDHTTVLHGADKIKRKMLVDSALAYDVAHVEAML